MPHQYQLKKLINKELLTKKVGYKIKAYLRRSRLSYYNKYWLDFCYSNAAFSFSFYIVLSQIILN